MSTFFIMRILFFPEKCATLMVRLFFSMIRLSQILTYSSIAILFFSGFASEIFADSAQILDNFKANQKRILFENVPFATGNANDIFLEEYIMNGLSGVMKKLDETKAQYEDQKEIISSRRATLEEFLKQTDADIANKLREIAQTEATISAKQSEISIKQNSMVELQQRIVKNKHVILEYLAYIYTKWDLLYDDSQNIDVLRGILMNDGDIQDTFSDIHYKTLVSQVGQQFIDEYRALTREYYSMMVSLDEEVIRLSTLEKQLERQHADLEDERAERARVLELTKWQEELYATYIQEQEKQQQNAVTAWHNAQDRYMTKFKNLAQEYGCNIENTGSVAPKCTEFQEFFLAEKSLIGSPSLISSTSQNAFSWPVVASRLSAFFHDPDYYSLLGSSHDAIDIPTPQGTAVRAPADGYIYYILPPTDGWYSYMAIKHANGLVTVYGHLSYVYGSLFQVVKKWDIIALSGWIPGTPGAGPMTSGAHLHFEVWKDGESVDPLRYLNIADLPYDSFPSRYNEKFIQDLEEKYGSNVDTSSYESSFQIRGETEEERQTYLLKTYASKAFQNRNDWVNAALDAKIDPSFVMCVWLAETTLGNYMKTAYNVGNVGNTDDGSVRSFSSASAGIAAMTQTFNNQFLWQYSKVSELSRWGNNRGLIYASSPENWHNNIIRCLSALKNRFVEDDYEFRLGPPTGL